MSSEFSPYVFKTYYRIFVLLHELNVRPPYSDRITFPNGDYRADVKKLKKTLKTGTLSDVDAFSRDVMLATVKSYMKLLPKPLLTRTSYSYHRWLEIGYYTQKVLCEMSDVTADLVTHIARVLCDHTNVYVQVLIQSLLATVRTLALENTDRTAAASSNTASFHHRLQEMADAFRPLLMGKPRWFWLNVVAHWRARRLNDPVEDTMPYLLRFLLTHIDQLFNESNKDRLSERIPVALRQWMRRVYRQTSRACSTTSSTSGRKGSMDEQEVEEDEVDDDDDDDGEVKGRTRF